MNYRVIIFLLVLLCVGLCYADMTVPRPVIQEVFNCCSVYPDSVSYPEDGTITFKARIAERPDYIITQEHLHSYAYMSGGRFVIYFNLGNFPGLTGAPVDWSVGEIVTIEVVHTPTGRIASTAFIIDDSSEPIIRVDDLALILKEPSEEFKSKSCCE